MDIIAGMSYNAGYEGVVAHLATLSNTEESRMPSKTIPLTQGFVTIVDEEDYDWLNQWKWHFSSHGYAARSIWLGKNKKKMMYMHRLIMGNPMDCEIDHVSGDKIDNRRCNLRLANKHGNSCNRPKRKQNNLTSFYKGVCLEKKTNKWLANLTLNQKQIYLGRFKIEKDAAIAYNKAAIKYFGEYAQLNEIPYE